MYGVLGHSAELCPDRPAIVSDAGTLTYGQLDRDVRALSAGLRGLGLAPGDRLLTYAPNVPEYLVTYLACAHAGLVFAPANVGFRARELAYVCANAEAHVAVVHAEVLDEFLARVGDAASAPRLLVILGAPVSASLEPGQIRFEELLERGAEAPRDPATVDPEAPLLICYTSGTTSKPKPVLHSHRSEVYNATTYAWVWRFGPGDRGLVALPLAWVYGLSTSSMALLAGGATILLRRRFHPRDTVRTIDSERATVMFGTMAMYNKMLEVSAAESADLSSLRLCVNGGEACTDAAVGAFETATGLRLLQAYALSEARPVLAVDPADAAAPRNVSGQPVPGAEIRLVGEGGRELGPGEAGEAEVRCPGMMTAYFREPAITAEKMTADGWIRTGDLLVRDPEGYYSVVGRRSEMIIRSGANVAPAEVESVLLELPEVNAVGVVGVPDPVSGEAVVAFVVADELDQLEPSRLAVRLGDDLSSFKLPGHVFGVDAIPVNASGKVDRGELRRRAVDLLGRGGEAAS